MNSDYCMALSHANKEATHMQFFCGCYNKILPTILASTSRVGARMVLKFERCLLGLLDKNLPKLPCLLVLY